MPEKTLIILTHNFPLQQGEEFLIDELNITGAYFEKIIICPLNVRDAGHPIQELPPNVEIFIPGNASFKGSNLKLLAGIFNILRKEFFRIPSAKLFFSTLKFNLSLLKQCYLKGLSISSFIKSPENTWIYSYWCDDLALVGAFAKTKTPGSTFISRAHGFDVFEEQSDSKHIFFRSFQLSALDKLWAVSKVGSKHLKMMNPAYRLKIDHGYLGIQSNERICYEPTDTIRIVTCSRIRSIKRLDLLIGSLKLISSQQVEWHVVGDGEDLEKIKELSLRLPQNCKVIFHGNMSTGGIHELYGNTHFDFLVSLSSSEGLPVSMMEAISHGIPVISTDVGGCKEIVNDTTGELIPVDFSPEFLAKKIGNCKNTKFNSLEQRKAIVAFWKENFNSKVNYENFAKDLLALKEE